MKSKVRAPRVFAILLLLVAAALLYGGIKLVAVGGSWYYLLSGVTIAACALLLWRRNPLALTIYGAFLAVTFVWSLYESGADLWALAPRVGWFAALGLWFLTPFVRRGVYEAPAPLFASSTNKIVAAGIVATVFAVIVLGAYVPIQSMPPRLPNNALPIVNNWQHYGNTNHGTRYAQLDQITPSSVGKLKELWHFRTGRSGQFKATPLQIGELLYVCTAMNVVIALDAETGEKRWEFDPQMKVAPVGFNTTCRGVSYFRAPDDYQGDCPARILMGTTDARLIALNAVTGARCKDFGIHEETLGEVTLTKGIGDIKPNVFMTTSPPLIARNLAIVGTRVADNLETNEPSGVIRAFHAVTGKFVWAWDMGRPGINTEPADGEQYTRGTANVWSMMSFDDNLGLIYMPTGNATPDFFGAHRSEAAEKYSSSVVALDVANGSVRWSFQTVHHDIWDYDVPSQPSLVDLPQADGSVIPALVQATKRGEIFLLDRRDGKPIAEVVEKPVPQNPVPQEWLAKTQPFSVGMPIFRDDLTEADMWGITPFDQIACRIEFKKLRYDGHFTPPSIEGSLQHPGNAGGFNWGSVAIDEDNKLLVVNPIFMPSRVKLIPRDQVAKGTRYLQTGTPYAASVMPMMSPLFVPCVKPPYSRMAVIDLQTREVLWSRRLGTTNEMGPLGTRVRVALPMGVPTSAGSLVTKGGVIFFGSAMDNFLRAFDVKTGKELWRESLPGTGQATPMSYLAPKSNRQLVVMTVPNRQRQLGMTGDAKADEDPEGGHIIAYAVQ